MAKKKDPSQKKYIILTPKGYVSDRGYTKNKCQAFRYSKLWLAQEDAAEIQGSKVLNSN